MTRGRSVLALLIIAGVLWLISTRDLVAFPPVTGTSPAGVAQAGEPATSGASPVLTALAAAFAVAGLLLSMLGTVGRRVLGVFLVLLGLGYAGAALGLALASGATVWAWIGVAAGVIAAGAGGSIGFGRTEWHSNQKYERADQTEVEDASEADPTAAWDALSRGEDPDDNR